jgi:hypothetical protein
MDVRDEPGMTTDNVMADRRVEEREDAADG